jgi:hypothetical protein
MMKKTFNLFLIAGALILGSCDKDVVTTYQTVEDPTITVEFQAYGPSAAPSIPDPSGTVMADSGIELITITGGDYDGQDLRAGEEIRLDQAVGYSVYWTFYDTSSPAELEGRQSILWLNYVNKPDSVTVYLGDEASDVKPVQH